MILIRLLGIEHLQYTPTSPYQLILGGNGIGKSSLMSELSPLPPDSSDLKENGYKYITIEHRGSTYQLRYNLHKKLDCSFIKDGKELNDGNTIKVQKDLIWEHFRYDNNIHDVLLGVVKLSNMVPQQRREWFVKMSRSDMSYAIGVFNKLKGAERDIKGAIKVNNQRLINEQTKLPNQQDIDRAKQLTDRLHQELNHLLPFKEHDLQDFSQELEDISAKLQNASQRLLDGEFNLTFEGLRDVYKIAKVWRKLRDEIGEISTKYKYAIDELAELQDIFTKNQQLTERPLSEIDGEIQAVNQQLQVNNQTHNQLNIDVGDNVEQQLQGYVEVAYLS